MVDQYHLSNPRLIDYTLADANTSGYASGVSGASWTLTATAPTDGVAHPVTILNNSANNKSSISITVVGTDQNGAALTETITGPTGSATVTTTGYFATVTSVTPASTWGADTANIGWSAAASSPWFNINVTAEDVLAVNVDISGTINFSVQQTFDTFQTPSAVRWQNVASSQTADNVWNTTGGATGVRIIVNSYSSGATIRVNFNATAISNSAGNGGGGASTRDVNLVQVGGAAISLGQATGAASVPVVIASNQSAVPTSISTYATVTATQVAANASAVQLLASNSSRRGATIYYDGAAILYLLEGSGTPSATNFTYKLGSAYFFSYEAPAGFTGAIQGIWSSATGSADITERS